MLYDSIKELFDNHVLECQEALKKDLPELEEYEKQINIKLTHSYRVMDNMEDLFQNLQFNSDYVDLGKSVGLLHDIGRFRQMLESGTYSDYASFEKKQGINDHGDYGAFILFQEKLITQSNIPKHYYGILYNAIKYHGKVSLPSFLNHYVDDINQYNKIKLDTLLASTPKPVNCYLKLLSLYVHAIRDVDKIDIYYQNLIDEFPIIRPYINYNPRGESIEYISKYWGINKQEIRDYNRLVYDDIGHKKLIKIPIANIDPQKFTLPQHFIDAFFEGKVPPVQEIVHHRWYTFIAAAIIRLDFLRNINFVSTLITLQEQQILDKIYEKYPEEYKPLIKPFFEYSKEVLLDKTIQENKDKIYIKRFMNN